MNAETIVVLGLLIYAAVGLAVAVAFVAAGVGRILGNGPAHTMAFTLGARLLILPGAAALWPYVLLRWRKASRG